MNVTTKLCFVGCIIYIFLKICKNVLKMGVRSFKLNENKFLGTMKPTIIFNVHVDFLDYKFMNIFYM